MEKRKIYTALLKYLSFSGPQSDVKSGGAFPVPENIPAGDDFIKSIVDGNIKTFQITPPEEIFRAILANKNQDIKDMSLKTVFGKILHKTQQTFLNRRLQFVFSPILIMIVLIAVLVTLKDEKPGFGQLKNREKSYVTIKEGETLQENGLIMSALLDGELAYEIKNQKEHVYLRKGYWQMDTDYSTFDNETWVHFPGGGIKPMGAQFYVEINFGITKITLSEGKIQLYSTDKNGIINKTTVEDAPFARSYTNGELASFYESDLLAEKSDSMVVQKDTPSDEKEEISVYHNFVGSYITVLLNDGNRLSGVLKKVLSEKLRIQTGTGLVEVPGGNLTLVELNTFDDK